LQLLFWMYQLVGGFAVHVENPAGLLSDGCSWAFRFVARWTSLFELNESSSAMVGRWK
jgi:hypothetical protein